MALAEENFVFGTETIRSKINCGVELQYRKNPLELSPVIRCILQYLNLKDIKKCRYINREWSSVGLILLTARSKIVFRKGSEDSDCERTPCRFLEVFSLASEAIPFTSFSIFGNIKSPWVVSDLNNFFQTRSDSIRELYIKDLYLVDEDGQLITELDITPWISNSSIVKPNAKYSTTLSVYPGTASGATTLAVQFSALINIKELELESCKVVDLQRDIKISPTDLKLYNVAFLENENRLEELCINDVVNFAKIKKIRLQCGTGNDLTREMVQNTKLLLDMGGNDEIVLDHLDLWDIKLINWSNCRWTAKKLGLWRIPFAQSTELSILLGTSCSSKGSNFKIGRE